MNGLGEDIGSTVLSGKVVRPLRSVDPSQTEYQGLIEVTEEGKEPGFYSDISQFKIMQGFS